MKQLSFLICITLALVGFSQSADEILRKHFEAHGQKSWNEIKTVTIDGKLIDSHFGRWPMQLIFKTPDQTKIVGKYQGKPYAEAYDGQNAWIKAAWKSKYEVQLMSAEEELVIRNTFSLGSPLYQYREHLKFEGLRDMEGTLYYTFVMDEAAYAKTYFIGRDDFRLYYEQIENKFGSSVSVLKVMEKYKSYGSLLIPTAVIFEGTDLDKELTFDEVYLDMGVKEQIFKMPNGQ